MASRRTAASVALNGGLAPAMDRRCAWSMIFRLPRVGDATRRPLTNRKPWPQQNRIVGRDSCTVCRFPPGPPSNGARLGSVRKCRIALRAGTGDFARPQFRHPGAFLPVPDRPLGGRQDIAAEALVSVAAADP